MLESTASPNAKDAQPKADVQPQQHQAAQQSEGRFAALRRAAKNLGLRALNQEPFNPISYSQQTIAGDILKHARNRVGENSDNPYDRRFGKNVLMSWKGNMLNRGPDGKPYQFTTKALEHLVQIGALRAGNYEEETGGETRFYEVSDPDLLRRVASGEEVEIPERQPAPSTDQG
jgi:hypothetical protein